MKKCGSCGWEKAFDGPYCGRCEKIIGDVQADLKAELGVGGWRRGGEWQKSGRRIEGALYNDKYAAWQRSRAGLLGKSRGNDE